MYLELQSIPSDEYFSNQIHGYWDGAGCADVYTSGPVLLWEHIGAGYVEPLDPFIAQSNDFDRADFFDPLMRSNRWSGRFGDRLGQGQLWEIPVNCEANRPSTGGSVMRCRRWALIVAVPPTCGLGRW